MNNIPMEVLNRASGTLSILTKARCVRSYSFPEETKFRFLYPWPLRTPEDKVAADWLAERGISYDTKTRVKAYEVSHADYKKKEKIKFDGLDQLELCRDLIVILILSQTPANNIEIKAFWDQSKHPTRTYPLSTSDISGIREFSRHPDSMLGFYHPSNVYGYKIPAYAGEVLFHEMGIFPNVEIRPEDRALSAGKRTDKRGVSNRFIIHKGNKAYLEKVSKSTINTVLEIVSGQTWAKTLKEKRATLIT